jgi:nucleoside-diphosphate-sugar epimerase
MSSKRILVTGAGGFIGLELCEHLAAAGHQVTGVDVRYPTGRSSSAFEQHTMDYRDISATKSLMRGQHVVFHLASAHLDVKLSNEVYWDVNVRGLVDLMSLAVAEGVERYVHVSSVSVYGNLESWPADENSPCQPQSVYGETKLAGEAEVRAFCDRTGLPAVILRPTWVYGATCPRTQKLYRASRNGTFAMIGGGTNVRHPIYIVDLLQALDLAMKKPVTGNETYIIGGGQVVATADLIDTMCRVFGLRKPWIRVPHLAGQVAARVIESGSAIIGIDPPVSRRTLEFFNTNNGFNISKARNELGFAPRYTLEEGLSDCRAAVVAMENYNQENEQ